MSYKVLIADDEAEIRNLLRLYLENESFTVIETGDGLKTLEAVRTNSPDILLLDIMMPGIDGLHVMQQLRKETNIPIMIISAKTADAERILGLNIGADDYINKPFNPLEVVARVQSNLRRKYTLDSGKMPDESGAMLVVGDLKLDTKKFILYDHDKEVFLTPTEFKILSMFMERPGMVFTKSQIYERINGEFYENDDNTMMVHISKLREKLGDNSKSPIYIKTVRGLGYKIEDPKK